MDLWRGGSLRNRGEAAAAGMTALRTQREGLTWVSDRDVEIKLPVTLYRRHRRPCPPPPKRPSYGFQILALSAVGAFAAGLGGDISTCQPRERAH